MQNPSNYPAWKLVDSFWLDFAAEDRNLRLGIARLFMARIYSKRHKLIDDLKKLQDEVIRAFDAYYKEEFTLSVVVLWTINGFFYLW